MSWPIPTKKNRSTASAASRSSRAAGGRKAKPRGVIVLSHGFNSHSGYYLWAAEQLLASGLAVYALDYRGRGKSDGERYYVDKFCRVPERSRPDW